MNKLAILFGATTVAFAGLTLYYAAELRKENDFFDAQATLVRSAPASVPTPTPSSSSPVHSAQSPTPDAMAPGTQMPVSNAPVPQAAAGKPAAKMSASDVDFIAMYATPQGRRTLIDEALMDQRNGLRGVAEKLGLT